MKSSADELIRRKDEEIDEDFFDFYMQAIYEEFQPSNAYGRNQIKGYNAYRDFYLVNSNVLAPMFRILYRMMDLIETSDINNLDKLRYAKIARAQLSESELFFLRYNCLVPYGKNFIDYINRYRLLKHLPILSMLEFKEFRDKMKMVDDEAYRSLNMIFHEAWKRIFRITIGKESRPTTILELFKYKKYKLYVDLTTLQSTTMRLDIDTSARITTPELRPLSMLTDDELATFLRYFLMEVYKFSNFKRYNQHLNFKKPKITMMPPLTCIEVKVSSNAPLRLSHPAWDNFYDIQPN